MKINLSLPGRIALFCAALVFCACASHGKANEAQYEFWLTLPQPGSIRLIGVSGPLLKRESEINAAREEAARKASMYSGVYVSFENTHSNGSSIFDYSARSSLVLQYDEDLEKYLERLSFDPERDVQRSGGSVYIRFAYPSVFPAFISYSFSRNADGRNADGRNADGSPVWIHRPPGEINGFPAGVGYAARQSRVKDTFAASRDSAAAAIISQLSTSVITGTALGYNATSILQRSAGKLARFLVLEIWVDPNTRAVWTLAIAQRAE